MTRQNIASGSPREPVIGFSRAVRIGNIVAVAGTGPMGADGKLVGLDDVAAQTRQCLETSMKALAEAGAKPEDVIRTRIMLTDISRWEDAAMVHGEFFGDIRPACTFVEVSGFVVPEWIVETEVDAVVAED